MGDKRTKQRITSKIDELPEDLRMKVDVMLADTSNTYEYISQFLKGEGYNISEPGSGLHGSCHTLDHERAPEQGGNRRGRVQ